METYTHLYPGRAYKERWVLGDDCTPKFVQAFECPSPMNEPWEYVWCPEVGYSIVYEYTYDNSHDAWETAKVKWAKRESIHNEAKEKFWKAYARREA